MPFMKRLNTQKIKNLTTLFVIKHLFPKSYRGKNKESNREKIYNTI